MGVFIAFFIQYLDAVLNYMCAFIVQNLFCSKMEPSSPKANAIFTCHLLRFSSILRDFGVKCGHAITWRARILVIALMSYERVFISSFEPGHMCTCAAMWILMVYACQARGTRFGQLMCLCMCTLAIMGRYYSLQTHQSIMWQKTI